MAGLFRKRQFKPWIVSCVTAKEKKIKSKVVKVLCRRSNDQHGSMVMLVSDGELSISAAFSLEAVENALSNIGLDKDARWDNALLIFQEINLELKVNKGEDVGEYVVYVEKFKIWDLQPGFTAKFDVKYCMEDSKVNDMMRDEVRAMKEREECQSEMDKTGSIGLSQLLDEMTKPSESSSEFSCIDVNDKTSKYTENKDLTQYLLEKLLGPLTMDEFLIPESQVEVLQNIPEWQPDYQPDGDTPSTYDQQFDVCAANTLSTVQDNANNKCQPSETKRSPELSQSVIYLGISVTPKQQTDDVEVREEKTSCGPVNALFKTGNTSLSQGTSSQWQNELESVEFSFEDSNVTSSQEMLDKLNSDVTMENYLGTIRQKGELNNIDRNKRCDKSNKDVIISENSSQIMETVDKSFKDKVSWIATAGNDKQVIQTTSIIGSPRREFGLPGAHSTQTNEIVQNCREDNQKYISSDIEVIFESTEENESQIKSLEIKDKKLQHSDRNDNDSAHNNSIGLTSSQDEINIVDNNSSMMNVSSNDCVAEVGASLSNKTDENSFSDNLEKSNSSKCNNWYDVFARQIEKSEKIPAVRHVASHVSAEISSTRIKAEPSDVAILSLKNTNLLLSKTVQEKVAKLDNGNSAGENETSKGNKSVNILEQITNCSIANEKGKIVSQNMAEVDQTMPECQIEVGVVNSSDTDYPLVSLSLRECSEDNVNCPLRLDDASDNTDLEEIDRIHREKIADYFETDEGENSDLSNMELSNNPIEQPVENVKVLNERQHLNNIHVSKHQLTDNSGKHMEENDKIRPFAPKYFETESGSKKRSRRLVRKVISCQEKDHQLNADNNSKPVYSDKNLVDSVNKYRKGRYLTHISHMVVTEGHVNKDDELTLNCHGNCDENKVVTKIQTDCNSSDTSSDFILDTKTHDKMISENFSFHSRLKYLKPQFLKKHTESAISVESKGGSGKQTRNSQIWTKIDDNILKSVSETNQIQWKFKRSVQIVLERCDRNEHICRENHKNTTNACNESDNDVKKRDGISVNVSKQNDALNHLSETEITCSSNSHDTKTLKGEKDVLKRSDNITRGPFYGSNVTSNVMRKSTKEKGKEINEGDTNLTSQTSLVDNFKEKSNNVLEREDKSDDTSAKVVQSTDCPDKDDNSKGVLRENETNQSNGNERTDNDFGSNRDTAKYLFTLQAENKMEASSADDTGRSDNKCEKYQSFQKIFTSPLQCTQPFEICKFPETQEFVPESPTKFENVSSDLNTSVNSQVSSIIPKTQPFVPTLSENLDQTPIPGVMTTIDDKSVHSGISDKISKHKIKYNEGENLKESEEIILKKSVDRQYVTKSPEVIRTSANMVLDVENDADKLIGNSLDNLSSLDNSVLQLNSMITKSPEVLKASADKLLFFKSNIEEVNKVGDNTEHLKPSGVVTISSNDKNNDQVNESNDVTIKDPANVKINDSADLKLFTKLMKKPEHHDIANDICTIVTPGKALFKVKPYRNLSLQRKRKSNNDVNNDESIQAGRKKQKIVKENSTASFEAKSKSFDVKETEKRPVNSSAVKVIDNASEDHAVIGRPSKKLKTFTEIVDDNDDDEDFIKNRKKAHEVERKGKPFKTYEPRKIYIDGKCFGNKVFWQNYIDSPYPAPTSCETKNKSCIENTNMRKSSLDSSQGSGNKGSQENDGDLVHATTINRSSESLFSADDKNEEDKDNSSPESVSLLPTTTQTGVSNISSKFSLKKLSEQVKGKETGNVLNNAGNKGDKSNPHFTRSDGVLKFYRQKTAVCTSNVKNKVSENLQIGEKLKSTIRNHIDCDNHLSNHSDKDISEVRQTKTRSNTKVEDKWTSLATKKSHLNDIEVLDKNMFVQDWLIRNNKIDEQSMSMTELSPPETETLGDSLPSYQPVSACHKQSHSGEQVKEKCYIINDTLDEEHQEKDTSRCNSSSAESSSSVHSEDLKKPMSAAARYLLKFKKARRERKKRELMRRKLERQTTNDKVGLI